MIDTILKGTVSGVGNVTGAVLRIYSNDLVANVQVFEESGNSWSEGTVTWNTAPGATGGALDTLSVSPATWYEFDVSSIITGDGTYSFRLLGDNTAFGMEFRSIEHANAPVLRVTHE